MVVASEALIIGGMSKHHTGWLLLLLLSACSAGGGSPEDLPGTPSEVAPEPEFAATSGPPPTVVIEQPGACEHLLWPLHDGASWVYQLTRSAEANVQSLSLETRVSGEAATLTLVAGERQVEHAITCAPDGFYGPPGGLVGHPDLGGALALTNPDRPFLPSADQLLPFGTPVSWDVQYDASGALALPLGDGAVEMTVSGGEVVLYMTAQALEPISVPAGTVNALAVEQSIFFNLQLTSADGSPGSLFGDTLSRLYFAEGTGLVRQTFEGGTLSGMVGQTPFAVELQAGISQDLLEYRAPPP